ncbi:MAG: hypothetical protein IPP37_07525 [Saprospiraceae bacterium]|nr:hypothetical protein [Saprospiraceae bacterium]
MRFLILIALFSVSFAGWGQQAVYNEDGFLISGEEVRNTPQSLNANRMMGCTPFYEGWESGSFIPTWTQLPAPITFTVQNSGAPIGQYYLRAQGGNSTHLQGLVSVLPSVQQPAYFSWRTKNEVSGTAGGYVVIGNSSITATNCIVFCYINNSQTLRFVSSITYVYNITPNTWHQVELKNVDYTSHTFDIYIDGVLHYTGFPFRSNTISDMDRIHVYNFNSGAIGGWDDIKVCEGGAAVNVGSAQSYGSLQDAIDAAIPGDTIQLLDDNSITNLDITNTVILKSGGFSLSLSGILSIPSGNTLTWWDHTMQFTGTGSITNEGTLHNRATIQSANQMTNSGVYKGTGSFTGNLINSGSVSPGN